MPRELRRRTTQSTREPATRAIWVACTFTPVPLLTRGRAQNYIYYFTVDNAGNYSSEPYTWVYIDTTMPVTTASLSGTVYTGNIYKSAVQVTLTGTTTGASGVAHTYYKLDGGAANNLLVTLHRFGAGHSFGQILERGWFR